MSVRADHDQPRRALNPRDRRYTSNSRVGVKPRDLLRWVDTYDTFGSWCVEELEMVAAGLEEVRRGRMDMDGLLAELYGDLEYAREVHRRSHRRAEFIKRKLADGPPRDRSK